MRFELMTSSLPRRRSTPELRGPVGQAVSLPPGLAGLPGRKNKLPACSTLERATRLELATLSLEG